MRSLFLFLFRFRAFITLVILEVFCAFLIIQNNNYQRVLFFNSSNRMAGDLLSITNNISTYFGLRHQNDLLSKENALLKQQVARLSTGNPVVLAIDTVRQFTFHTAEVVNNTVDLRNNSLTIRIGRQQGITPGMGVVGGGGIVGKVRYVSPKYSVVTSLLHTEGMLSATVKNKVDLCTVQWSGQDPTEVDLLYIPRSYSIDVGDTVETSGYNAIFPKGLYVGTVSRVNLSPEAPFYDIKVKLGNDFRTLDYVDVIENKDLPELDSLQREISNE